MNQIIFEAKIEREDIHIEDGGCTVIIEPEWQVSCGDDNIFLRIQSWDESIGDNDMYDQAASRETNSKLGHKSIYSLSGKKVRVTVEIIEDSV